MGMELGHYVTVIGTAVAAVGVGWVGFIPPPWNFVASGAVAGIGALWHLWMSSPWSQ